MSNWGSSSSGQPCSTARLCHWAHLPKRGTVVVVVVVVEVVEVVDVVVEAMLGTGLNSMVGTGFSVLAPHAVIKIIVKTIPKKRFK